MRKLYIDIENLAELVWVWQLRETDAIDVERPGHLLCVAWQWEGESKIHSIGQNDFKGYKPKSGDDKKLCQFIHKLLSEADIVIGHNAKSFDIKKINYRMMVNGLKPVSPYRIIDTLTEYRKVAKAPSHRLNAIGKDFKIGAKKEHEGWALWKKCYLGDPDAWNRMQSYNRQDIKLLRDWYMILRPWIEKHPITTESTNACQNCGAKRLNHRGFNILAGGKKREKLQCQSCGSWHSGNLVK